MWVLLSLIVLGSTPLSLALVVTRPILSNMDMALAVTHYDHLAIKLMVGIMGIGVVAGAPVAAFLFKKFGSRRLLPVALTIYAVAGCAPFFLSDLYAILASRAVVGFSGVAVQLTSLTLAGDYFPPARRAQLIGYATAAAVSCALIGAPLSGMIGNVDWHWSFLLHAFALPLVVLATLGLPSNTRLLPDKPSGPVARTPLWSGTPRKLIILAFMCGLIGMLPAIYFTFRLHEVGVIAPSLVGLAFLSMSIPDVIGGFFFGRLRGRFSAQAVFVLAFILAAIGLSVAALSPTPGGVLPGMACYGAALGLLASNLFNVAAEDEEQRARMVSLVTSVVYISTLFGLLGVELGMRDLGAQGALLGLAGLAAIAGIVLMGRMISGRKPVGLARAV